MDINVQKLTSPTGQKGRKMNIVKFPGLNLEFEFSKIAFSFFGIDVYKYAICIVLGIVVALILSKLSKENYSISYDFLLENVILGMFFGIIGARLYFVLFNIEYYFQNPIYIFKLRDGGLAIYGGLIFGTISIIINCKLKKKDILDFLDYIVPFVAIAQCFGRIGNFFNIEAFGYETKSVFRMGIATINGYTEVHPMFFYEAVSTFFIFCILRIFQKKRKFKGEIFLLYLIFYSSIRAVLEGMRTDSLMLFNWRISQVLSILIFLISLCVIICRKMSNEKSLKS